MPHESAEACDDEHGLSEVFRWRVSVLAGAGGEDVQPGVAEEEFDGRFGDLVAEADHVWPATLIRYAPMAVRCPSVASESRSWPCRTT